MLTHLVCHHTLTYQSLIRDCLIAESSVERVRKHAEELRASLSAAAPDMVWSEDVEDATCALVLLSRTSVDATSRSCALIERAAAAAQPFAFVYIGRSSAECDDEAWDYHAFYARHASAPSAASRAIKSNEALVLRSARRPYEHRAMVREIGRRLRAARRPPRPPHPPMLAERVRT